MGLCDRFKCLPSQLYREDVELVRMLKIEKLGTPEETEAEEVEEYG